MSERESLLPPRTPDWADFTNEPPPDSPLRELRALWEYVELSNDWLSQDNWTIVEAAMDRVARIVVAADKWAHAYEACSTDPAELRLWRVVRGVQDGVTLDPGREHPSPHAPCDHAVEFGSMVCLICGMETVPGQARVYRATFELPDGGRYCPSCGSGVLRDVETEPRNHVASSLKERDVSD